MQLQRHLTALLSVLFFAGISSVWAQTPPPPSPPAPPVQAPAPPPVQTEAFEAQMRQFEAHMQAWAQNLDGWNQDMREWGREMEVWGQDMEVWGAAMEAWGQKMEQFGQRLDEMLVADGLIEEGEKDLDLEFYEDHMVVKDQRVEGEAYAKYRRLLKQYDVQIGQDGKMIFSPPAFEKE